APLIDGWKYTETLPADTPVPPQWVLQAAPAGQQIYWLAGESHPKAPSVVLHVAEKGPAWDALVQGLRAWTYAVDSLQLLPAESPIVVCQGDAHALLETIETLGPKPLAWVTVSTQPSEPTTLFRGPDPMAKPLEEGVEPPSNGLAIVLRLALVDVGLLTRPWLSLERPFDGDRAGWDLAVAGIAFAHWALGSSGLDLAKSDHPELGETARNQLGLWAAVQCLVAPSPADLNRYLDSVKLEMRLRYNQNDEAETLRWKAWLTGARLWLRKRALLLEDETR
ncbi:MAG TPA: hypothetical protein PLJ12_08665, partial [Planctomycetota bacterium]|nr:hypothetical protein [Planctomycetota bacterium]